jgi:hypothetical protein
MIPLFRENPIEAFAKITREPESIINITNYSEIPIGRMFICLNAQLLVARGIIGFVHTDNPAIDPQRTREGVSCRSRRRRDGNERQKAAATEKKN